MIFVKKKLEDASVFEMLLTLFEIQKKKLEDAKGKFISNNVANNYRGQFIPHIPIYSCLLMAIIIVI